MIGKMPCVSAVCLVTAAYAGWSEVLLRNAVVVSPSGQPRYVQHSVEDLSGYLSEISGATVSMREGLEGPGDVLICIGAETARRVLGQSLDEFSLGSEGCLIKHLSKEGKDYVVVTGETPMGTKNAVGRLMLLIRSRGREPNIEMTDSLVSKPSFARRGMHFNGWPFGYPYTFRKWKEQDWKSYIDILSYQGINLLYLWPFMEIIPIPLSGQDKEYLLEYRRIIDYAQTEHGMEVWMMQSPNRVANSDLGVADAKGRPYWKMEVQQDLNPADPEQFSRIMASREAFYRVIDNVDGVCTIDSDPGWCEGSPVSDYVKILKGCRQLLDQCNLHGTKTQMIHWMWCGWGHKKEDYFRSDKQIETIRAIKAELPEPWLLVAGMEGFLPICRDEQVIEKTVLLRYGAIEDEPSYPATNLDLTKVTGIFACLKDNPNLAGIMGNMQIPLLQFPLEHFVAGIAWDAESRNRGGKDVFPEVAEYLYPDQRPLINQCFEVLSSTDTHEIEAVAAELEKVINRNALGRPGVFGRKLFPGSGIVAEGLLSQLKLRAAQESLVATLAAGSNKEELARSLHRFFVQYLSWDMQHGWHDYWENTQGWGQGWFLGRFSLDSRFKTVIGQIRQILGDQGIKAEEVKAFLTGVCSDLETEYGAKRINTYLVEPLTKTILEGEPVK
jgi:hypothetical protein